MSSFGAPHTFYLDSSLTETDLALATELGITSVVPPRALIATVWVVDPASFDFDLIPHGWHIPITVLDSAWLRACKERGVFVGEEEDWASSKMNDTRGLEIFGQVTILLEESLRSSDVEAKLLTYNAAITTSLTDFTHYLVATDPSSNLFSALQHSRGCQYLFHLESSLTSLNKKIVDGLAWTKHAIRTGTIEDERFAVDFRKLKQDGEVVAAANEETRTQAAMMEDLMEELQEDESDGEKRSPDDFEKEGLNHDSYHVSQVSPHTDESDDELEAAAGHGRAFRPFWTTEELDQLVLCLSNHPILAEAFQAFYSTHPNRSLEAIKNKHHRDNAWFDEKLVNLKATSRSDRPEPGLPLGLDEDDGNVRIKRSTAGKRAWSVSERNAFVQTLAEHSGSAVSVAIETFASRSQNQTVYPKRTENAVWTMYWQGLVGGTRPWRDLADSYAQGTLDFASVEYVTQRPRRSRKSAVDVGEDGDEEEDIGDDGDDDNGFMSDASSALTDLEEEMMSEANFLLPPIPSMPDAPSGKEPASQSSPPPTSTSTKDRVPSPPEPHLHVDKGKRRADPVIDVERNSAEGDVDRRKRLKEEVQDQTFPSSSSSIVDSSSSSIPRPIVSLSPFSQAQHQLTLPTTAPHLLEGSMCRESAHVSDDGSVDMDIESDQGV